MMSREKIVEQWKAQGRAGSLVVGCGVACGWAARSAEQAGLDLLLVDAGAQATLAGRSPLQALFALNDANEVARSLATEVLSVVESVPVLAGLFGQDSSVRLNQLIGELRQAGYSGVCNSPSVGCIDGTFRDQLEAEGLGFKKEVDLIAAASDAGLFTLAQVFTEREAEAMVAAGADALVLFPRVAVGLAHRVNSVVEAARAVDPAVMILLSSNESTTRADVDQLFSQVRGVAGVLFTGRFDPAPLAEWKRDSAGSA
jgi:predicted TIM-barrel enzyme